MLRHAIERLRGMGAVTHSSYYPVLLCSICFQITIFIHGVVRVNLRSIMAAIILCFYEKRHKRTESILQCEHTAA